MADTSSEHAAAMIDKRDIRSFGQALSDIQSAWSERIDSSAPVSDETARRRLAEGLSALQDEAPEIDPDLFRSVVVALAREFWPGAKADEVVPALLADRELDPENVHDFLRQMLTDASTRITTLAERVDVEPDGLIAVIEMALSPFYQRCATALRHCVDEAEWHRGFCPVCGEAPRMARLPEGHAPRSLYCGLCRTEWPFPRLRCPACDNTDQDTLRHLVADGDPAHRVDVCEACRRYIKSSRSGDAPLPIEDLMTYDLDLAAMAEGYRPVAESRTA